MIASPLHTAGVVVFIAAVAAFSAFSAHRARVAEVNRIRSYVASMVLEWVLFALVMWGSRTRDILGPKWRSARQLAVDVGVALAFWLAADIVLAVIARILHVPSAVRNLQFLLPKGISETLLWVAVAVTAGIVEETVFRGYLQRQLGALMDNGMAGLTLSAVIFGAAHIYQGWRPAVLIAVYGAMFGVLAERRKSVRPGMIAHAWQDSIVGILGRLAARGGP